MSIRLNKLLARRGIGARRKCDLLIQQGRVSVNGRVVREPGTMVEPEQDRVQVAGRSLPPSVEHRYYVLNKPVGVISTLDDPEGRRTVRELLPPGPRLFPVGRLDADTSGLLMLTNDGELAHRLMHPRYGVEKVYRAWLDHAPSLTQLARLRAGVEFEPGVVSEPARVRALQAEGGRGLIEIVIHEGRYRQVRRMCEAVGLRVTGLHRWAYGPVRLGPIERGMWRELSDAEVARLRAASARPRARLRPGAREFFSARRGLTRSGLGLPAARRGGPPPARREGLSAARREGPPPARRGSSPAARREGPPARRGGSPAIRSRTSRPDSAPRARGARERTQRPDHSPRAYNPRQRMERSDRAPRPRVERERFQVPDRPPRAYEPRARTERSDRAPRARVARERTQRPDRSPRAFTPRQRMERPDRAPRARVARERTQRPDRSPRAFTPRQRMERHDRAPRARGVRERVQGSARPPRARGVRERIQGAARPPRPRGVRERIQGAERAPRALDPRRRMERPSRSPLARGPREGPARAPRARGPLGQNPRGGARRRNGGRPSRPERPRRRP